MNRLPETTDGIVTSWIPITTAYPQKPGCSERYWSYVESTIAAWDPGYGISYSDYGCLPRPVTTWWDQDRLGPNPSTVVSLGPITCPDAYYTASTSKKDESSTFVACCPSGYIFADFLDRGSTGECYSKVDAGKVISYIIRDEAQNWQESTLTFDSATTVAAIQVNGWVFASQTGTVTGSGSVVSTQGSTPTSSCASNSASSPDLSAGARAGIGVGIALGIIGIATLAAGLFMMRRSRRKPSNRSSISSTTAVVTSSVPTQPSSPFKFQQPTVELSAGRMADAELPVAANMNHYAYMSNSALSPSSATTTTYLPPGDLQPQGWSPNGQWR